MDAKAMYNRILEALLACREQARRRVRVKCGTLNKIDYCLYSYKAVDWRTFYDYPCIAYARGTVIINGDIMMLPFTKFFNVDETPATRRSVLPEKPVAVYEKLDGTLTILWRDPYTGAIRGNTRGLLWYHNELGEGEPSDAIRNPFVNGVFEYARRNSILYELESIVDDHSIVMFEVVVPGMPASRTHTLQRISEYARLATEKGEAYLLAARDARTLRLRQPGDEWPLTPRRLPGDPVVLEKILAEYKGEGVVAWYERVPYEGLLSMLDPLVKYKSRRYLVEVTGIQSKRGLLAYALTGGLDDLRTMVDDTTLQYLEEAYQEYVLIRELAAKLSPHARLLKGYGLRGWLLQAVENPDMLLPTLLRISPKDLSKVPAFLRKNREKLLLIAGRAGVEV